MTTSGERVYVLVNKDLKMSIGKVAAQVAHATMRVAEHRGYAETVIVLEASGEQMRNLSQYLWDKDIYNVLYIDEGVNEVPPYSITALAVEPLSRYIFDSNSNLWDMFEGFPLLSAPKWIKEFYKR